MTEQVSLKTLKCKACGADLTFDPGTQAAVCNYCGNSIQIEEAKDKLVQKPDGILPFLVLKEQYHQKLMEWMAQGDYTPDDILDSSVFDQVNGVYLPLFCYVGSYKADWVASSGYNREESYLDKSFDGKRIVTKTRTVTDWRPSQGKDAGQFVESAFAGTGLKPEIANFAAGCSYDKGALKDFDPRYTLGYVLQDFTEDEDTVFESVVKQRVKKIAESNIASKIPGDKHKDVSYEMAITKEVLRVYAPCWVVYYKYKGSEYHVVMDGRNDQRIEGQRPEDRGRKEAVQRLEHPARVFSIISMTLLALGFVGVCVADEGSDAFAAFSTLTALGLLAVPVAITLKVLAWRRKKHLVETSRRLRELSLKRLTVDKLGGATSEASGASGHPSVHPRNGKTTRPAWQIYLLTILLAPAGLIFMWTGPVRGKSGVWSTRHKWIVTLVVCAVVLVSILLQWKSGDAAEAELRAKYADRLRPPLFAYDDLDQILTSAGCAPVVEEAEDLSGHSVEIALEQGKLPRLYRLISCDDPNGIHVWLETEPGEKSLLAVSLDRSPSLGSMSAFYHLVVANYLDHLSTGDDVRTLLKNLGDSFIECEKKLKPHSEEVCTVSGTSPKANPKYSVLADLLEHKERKKVYYLEFVSKSPAYFRQQESK